jgi:phage terminase large subunit
MTTAQIKCPKKLADLFTIPRGKVKYRCAYGGRGSGKSRTFATMAALYGYREPLKILCTREFQSSILHSFYAEIKTAIADIPFLAAHYDVGVNYIKGANGTEFIFAGLRNNISTIKSLSGVDICIIEEAETIPEYAYKDLIPTIRAENAEFWVIWNPCDKDSPTDKRFRQNIDSDMAVVKINYTDNIFFPKTLEIERQRDQRNLDDSVYRHIWEGEYLEMSEAQILKGKYVVADFKPQIEWNGSYWGCDWGFSNDPTTLVKLWIYENTLYVEQELYQVGVEIDHLPKFFDKIEGSRNYIIYADSARPETISYMRRHGFNIKGAVKGKGSVEDGIAHLRSFDKIVIHPRCVNFAEECRTYQYKTDRLSGDILPMPIDANNHMIDAARYALEPIMMRGIGANIAYEDAKTTRWEEYEYGD